MCGLSELRFTAIFQHVSIVFLSGCNNLLEEALTGLASRISLVDQLGQGGLGYLVALTTWQVRDIDSILGQIAGQNEGLLKLQVVVLFVDTFVFVIFAG
jgi:hypothetical protein